MRLNICYECRAHNEAKPIGKLYEGGECELCGSVSDMLRLVDIQPRPPFSSAAEAIETWFSALFPND